MDNELLDTSRAGSQLEITHQIQSYFTEIVKWSKFLSIMGFIFMGLMIIFGLFSTVMIAKYPPGGPMGGGPNAAIGLFYVVLALIYYFPTMYFYRFSKNLKLGITSGDQANYETSFKNLKSSLKFMGIFTIAMIVFYILAIIGGLVFFVAGDAANPF